MPCPFLFEYIFFLKSPVCLTGVALVKLVAYGEYGFYGKDENEAARRCLNWSNCFMKKYFLNLTVVLLLVFVGNASQIAYSASGVN